ncbi:MAG: hypothetical protein ACR2PA_14650 [Hyphomicrobiaceae bacterium]
MIKHLGVISLATLATLVVGVAASGPASAALCKSHSHVGVSTLKVHKSKAMRQAKRRWSKAVRLHDGKRYARWAFAVNKSVSIRKIGHRWRARARGRGCMGPTSITTLTQ